jgi:hypothetical protein
MWTFQNASKISRVTSFPSTEVMSFTLEGNDQTGNKNCDVRRG